MKTLKYIVASYLMLVFLNSLTSCKNKTNTSSDPIEEPQMVTETFEANLIGTYKYVGPDTLPNRKCTDTLTAWRAIVDVQGTSDVFGNLTGHFDFCGDEESHYGKTYAYLVDKDTDTLFIDISGQVLDGRMEDHPEYVTSYWKDPFTITGGTGKYEGATGNGMSDDYNSSEDPNSHHRWKGTINLQKQRACK